MSNYIIQFWCITHLRLCAGILFFFSLDPQSTQFYISGQAENIEDIRSCQFRYPPKSCPRVSIYVCCIIIFHLRRLQIGNRPINEGSLFFFFSFYLDSNSIEQKNWEHSPFFFCILHHKDAQIYSVHRVISFTCCNKGQRWWSGGDQL